MFLHFSSSFTCFFISSFFFMLSFFFMFSFFPKFFFLFFFFLFVFFFFFHFFIFLLLFFILPCFYFSSFFFFFHNFFHSSIFFFHFPIFFFFSCFFFPFSSRPSRRQKPKKIVEQFSLLKGRFSFVKILIFWASVDRMLRVVHLRVTSLLSFSVFFFFFHFCFFLEKLFLLFNCRCFLRSRCSMEMWCPDDIGRDSWDWVGPPTWRRACFNSPEWSGGSSPVKTEPHQIVLLLLFLTRMRECVCAQHLHPATATSELNDHASLETWVCTKTQGITLLQS